MGTERRHCCWWKRIGGGDKPTLPPSRSLRGWRGHGDRCWLLQSPHRGMEARCDEWHSAGRWQRARKATWSVEWTDSLIICDSDNRRVTRWPRRKGTRSGETIVDNIDCFGLTMDDEGSLYVTDVGKHEVRRYRRGETNGTVVAGGNGKGAALNQLNYPRYVCVDEEHAVYVSEEGNHRVMKWMKGAKEGIVVAGERGQGEDLTQLSHPRGVSVDATGNVYVADSSNNRVMLWCRGASQGAVVVGGNGSGEGANQFIFPIGLSFDRHGHLYVVDSGNSRVQRFSLEKNWIKKHFLVSLSFSLNQENT